MRCINMNNSIDILFIDGLEPIHLNPSNSYLTYLFPMIPYMNKSKYIYKVLNLTTIENYDSQSFIDELRNYDIKLIGMTTNADNIRIVYQIIKCIKEYNSDIKIILGGAQASHCSEKILFETDTDVIVRGEGEYTLIEVMDYFIRKKGLLQDILGISYKKNGKIYSNQERGYLSLEHCSLPFYDIVNDYSFWIIPKSIKKIQFDGFLKRVKRINSIFLTSRGCPFKCAFCVEGNPGIILRRKTIPKVIEDFHNFMDAFNTPYIIIGDDTFTSSRDRVIELCKTLKELRKERDFIWFAEGRVDILSKNLDLIEIMYDAGLYKLQIGIESGSQQILDKYGKGIKVWQIEKVVEHASKYENLMLHGNFIIGNPGETLKTFQESIEFAKKLITLSNFKLDTSSGYLVPFAGTPIANNLDDYGIELLSNNFEFERTPFIEPICRPIDIPIDELENMQIKFESEILSFIKKNIWSLPKDRIDKKISFDKKYGSYETGVISSSWQKTFYKLFTFKKYYSFFDKNIVIKDSKHNLNGDYEKIMKYKPLALWDIEYDESGFYSFNSFNGEKVILKGKDLFLWETASGKSSIADVINSREGINLGIDLEYASKYYLKLEDSFAIVFIY
jgi:radical SAM superfamily enzyme YgiQ (UPF0313 family)